MLESFAQIEYDEKRRATYIMAAEAMKGETIKTPLGGGILLHCEFYCAYNWWQQLG